MSWQPSPAYGYSTWDYVNAHDYGRIDPIYHITPGTPDGTYTVNLATRNNNTPSIQVTITNGVPSPTTLTDWVRADDLPVGGGVEVVTREGDSAALIRSDVYYGALGAPYTGNDIPDVQWKTTTVNIYLPQVTPTPTPTPPPPPPTGQQTTRDDRREPKCVKTAGMARYSVHSMLVSLSIEDTPVGYTPPRGPRMNFTVTYNQRETQQPAVMNYSNLGPNWTFNWLAFVWDDPQVGYRPENTVYMRGGGSQTYSLLTDADWMHPQNGASLTAYGGYDHYYSRNMPDGGMEFFGLKDPSTTYPRKMFLTRVVDATQQAVDIGYDSQYRVVTLTDGLGQVTTISYELASDPYKITKVTDPFGRFASFEYVNGQLATITDVAGMQSRITYLPGTSTVDSLTTPYGTTTFASGENGTQRWIEITDPLGAKERVEYRDQAPGISASDPSAPVAQGIVNAGLDMANTFYWDKKAMLTAPGDYSKAKITHWLYAADGSLSGIVGSEKLPLENRVWYTYVGQPDYLHAGPNGKPSQVARLLADGTTQLRTFEYNSRWNTTKEVDAVGRVTTYLYDPYGFDVEEVRQTRGATTDLLRKTTYDTYKHLPLTVTDAAGQVTTYTYTIDAQLQTRKNAKNETTTYAYGGTAPPGYLESITSPPFNSVSAVTRFGYDGAKRVRTIADSDSYTTTTDYDNLDRKIKVTYPDATYEQFQYTDNVTGAMTLDLTGSRDRRGLWTYRHYNANQQMDSITDPANRTTQYGYCTCGALTSITDPKNQTTLFNRDIQRRVYQKVFQDGTTIDYLYEGQTAPNTAGATSRLQSSTDAKSQRTNYTYFADDAIHQISYTNIVGQPLTPPTPAVSYTYDPNYNRVVTMTDGIGTTTYGYNAIAVPPTLGAGQLASIDAPLANDTITLSYDQLGRITSRSVNGTANSETWTFDSLGRVSTDVNKLGTFTNTYVGVTDRLSKVLYPGGASANYLYFPNAQDKRLQQIKNLTSANKNNLMSQQDYTYDFEGQVKTWTKNYTGLAAPQRLDLGYDNADELLTAPLKNASTSALIKQYTYGYDPASNRTSETVATTTTASTPNNVNEITSQSGGVNRTLTYDFNGSITNDGGTRTFEWDGANRLVAINYTGFTTRSEFSYDGLNRMAKIVEKTGATINSTRKFVWHGQEKLEFRDASDALTQRNFSQGQYVGTTAYFYTRDHLGSIREMFTGGGTVVARYDYDPFGRSTTVLGTTPTDFNFTGLYRHSKSNLDLAVYRAYDPDLGRWLSRDPLNNAELTQGTNLYAYLNDGPLDAVDPLGMGDTGLHWGFVINLTPHPLQVFGGTGRGQQVWTMPAYSTSLSSANPFTNKDVDGIVLRGQVMKVSGLFGSTVYMSTPWQIDPDSLLGTLLRGGYLGLNPLIPDENFKDVFGGPLVPEKPCP
ncbi:MAG TPA: RHS repeat-associated core domain-containing protein [Chthoniobacterales bacterium]|nr:RHS repeat-associated core domain-containing protein [Chthoniobacterales bacterium]